MRKIAVFAAVFALTAAIAGGCGSSEKTSSKKTRSEKVTEAATVEEATAETETEEVTEAETTEASAETAAESVDDALKRKMVDELSPITWDYESDLKTQTVGDDRFGHIDIPEDWFLDEDVAALTDDILTYENKPYEINGRVAMDTTILDIVDPSALRDRFSDILTDAAKDKEATEIATIAEELDGKMSSGVIVKYDDLHKLMLHLFVTDDAETEVYFICIETSNPEIIDLYKTYKRPVKD
ncbi:MAG: hypothetical protein IKH96_12885 [Ruminococcus sp.]|uniref:hypothetical protein n=1 Tax=Ruminococcus sp. TaxID=41978 RepID=UPI0025D34987|nr:hypothetical protein [Ruminococcus sp.]MBR6996889.1 hypothetical protein [Ruminococcus sp.]